MRCFIFKAGSFLLFKNRSCELTNMSGKKIKCRVNLPKCAKLWTGVLMFIPSMCFPFPNKDRL